MFPPSAKPCGLLDSRDVSVLASFAKILLEEDIADSAYMDWIGGSGLEAQHFKGLWKIQWEHCVRQGISNIRRNTPSRILPERSPELKQHFEFLQQPANRPTALTIFVELCCFDAYWPMKPEQKEYCGLHLIERTHQDFLGRFAEQIGFPADYGKLVSERMQDFLRQLLPGVEHKTIPCLSEWKGTIFAEAMALPFFHGFLDPALTTIGPEMLRAGCAALGAGICYLDGGPSDVCLLAGGGMFHSAAAQARLLSLHEIPKRTMAVAAAKLLTIRSECQHGQFSQSAAHRCHGQPGLQMKLGPPQEGDKQGLFEGRERILERLQRLWQEIN